MPFSKMYRNQKTIKLIINLLFWLHIGVLFIANIYMSISSLKTACGFLLVIVFLYFCYLIPTSENNIEAVIYTATVIILLVIKIMMLHGLVFIPLFVIIIYVGALAILYLFAVLFTGNGSSNTRVSTIKPLQGGWLLNLVGLACIYFTWTQFPFKEGFWPKPWSWIAELGKSNVTEFFNEINNHFSYQLALIKKSEAVELGSFLFNHMAPEVILLGLMLLITLMAVFKITWVEATPTVSSTSVSGHPSSVKKMLNFLYEKESSAIIGVLILGNFFMAISFYLTSNRANRIGLSKKVLFGQLLYSYITFKLIVTVFERFINNQYQVTIFKFIILNIYENPTYLGLELNTLSFSMLFLIWLISSAMLIFSSIYMAVEPHYARFLGHVHLFVFFMQVLVTSPSVVQLFIGWEGVGVCSYLLVSFWSTRIQAVRASNLAIIQNGFGDAMVLGAIAILLVNNCNEWSNLHLFQWMEMRNPP